MADIGLIELPHDRLDPIVLRLTAPAETIHNELSDLNPAMVADAILVADALG